MVMKIALIGYRGSGKTSIGRKLADRLWYKFVDVDDLIVRKAGKSIREIFAQDGEPAFRDIETEALREVLALDDHVIGMGGGTLGREENRAMLRESGAKVVYLRCEAEQLLRRVQADPRSAENRPNLTNLGGGIEEIRQVLAQREPIYREVKHIELDVTRLSIDEAVAYVGRML
jgi:shikimate kinase